MKKFIKITGYALLSILLLVALVIWLLSMEKYQNMLVKRVAKYLSEKLQTRVEVKHVRFSFFNDFNIEGVFIEDHNKDTLAYLGNIQIRTSDLLSNYWNGGTPVIRVLDIKDAYVHMNRAKNDSIWNYDFIGVAFKSSGTSDTSVKPTAPETKKVASESEAMFDLKKLSVQNLRFYMDDSWRGQDMRFAFNALDLDFKDFDLGKKQIDINSLNISGADVFIKAYTGGKPPDLSPDDTTNWGTPFNPGNFQISMSKFSLTGSVFKYLQGEPISKPKEFDAKNLGLTNINISLANTRIVADSIFSDIEKLEAEERCGLAIKKMQAKLKLSQVQAQLSEMRIETNKAILEDYFEMRYRNFHDFQHFINRVEMTADLKNSVLTSADLAFFSNTLMQYPIALHLSGAIKGTVDNLSASNMMLQTGQTYFNGDIWVKGLPDIHKTFFSSTIRKLRTSGSELNHLIPQTRVDAVAWKDLQFIEYSGQYAGTVKQFQTKGNVLTSLGNAFVDLDLDLSGKTPGYAGIIRTDDFNLGKLVKQSTIGHIGFNGKFKGRGFDFNSLNARLEAAISKIEIDGVMYRDMAVNGLVSNKKFDGIFISKDPNLTFNFDGKMDLSGKEPLMNFHSRILRFDLQKIGLTEESVVVSCIASLNFRGDDIDAFLGDAFLSDIILETKEKKEFIDTISLVSLIVNDEKIIRLKSSLADAELKGKFNISELATSFQLYLSHYLPSYIRKPQKSINEQFAYSIQIKNITPLLDLFAPKVNGLNGALVSGAINTYEKKFSMDTYIPTVGYDLIKFKELYLVSAGDFESFDANVNSGNFLYNEEVMIPSFQINTNLAKDTAMLEINTQSINDLLGNASVKIKGTAFNNNLYLNLLPSNVSIKKDKWQLYSRNEIVWGEVVSIKDLIIESGAQKISVNTQTNGTNDLMANLENIDLESIADYAGITSPQYFGRISGNLLITDFLKNPNLNLGIYSNNELRVDLDTIGKIALYAKYDVQNQLLEIDKRTTISRSIENTTVSGQVNFKDSSVNLQASLNQSDIRFVGHFIDEYIKDLEGKVTGVVNVKGRLDEPVISGNLDLSACRMKIIFLGTQYRIPTAKLRFNNRKIEMDDVLVYDERAGSYSGKIRGAISHHNFRDFSLNMNFSSPNFLCLNTREWEADLFYGYVTASVNASISGYVNDLVVDIDAKPLKGSAFHLPINSSGDAGKYEYVKFVEIGRSQTDEIGERKSTNYLKLTMNIDATPDIETFIVLDSNTGEEIRARGNGALKLIVDLGNSMEMYGTYVITEGKYLFKFRGVINREFSIDEGSKISWTGDALAAQMDVKAIYTLPKPLALYPLVSDKFSTLDAVDQYEAKRTYKTMVPLTLTGSLSQPNIKFDIIQPENRAVGSMAYTKLEQMKNDPQELFNQASILLLLGDFKASDGIAGASYSQGAVSTVSDLVGTAVSSEITNLFQNLTELKNISLNVGYQSLSNESNFYSSNRNQFSFGISANLLKERVIVDFGNSVDFGRDITGTTSSNYNIGGDFKAQLLITKDGRFRASAYRTNNVDIGGSPFTRGGIGLSYKKVFNSFADLISGKSKRKILITDTTSHI